LKKMQKEVQRYCRESLSILLEIAAAKFELETIKQMTGLPFMTEMEKAQVKQQMQMMQQNAQAMAAQAQAAGQQPPPPPPQPPAEVMEALAAPSWEQILKVLQNDVALHYKVDIETNSTIDAEAAQDKQDISEVLNAVSQFLNGVAPLVQQGVMPIEIAKTMLLVVTRRFNFGSQLEDALNQMKEPPKQGDPAAEAKAEAAKQQAMLDSARAKADMEKMQLDAQLSQQEFENKKALMALEAQISQMELEIKREELALQREGLAAKAQFQRESQRLKLEAMKAKPKETVDD
ncbi:MAG TPA: hypothetical protein VIY48_03625, partial [Candidatus Paceibacterota bacterium]